MTQITAEQQQRVRATAERAMTRLSACIDALSNDERAVLAAVLQQFDGAAAPAGDVTGHFFILPAVVAAHVERRSSGGLDAVNSIDWQKVYDALSVKW